MGKPKIRFQGYTEDWEQRKLGEIASSFEYGLNAAAKEYDGENKYIRITDIDDNTHEFLADSLTSPDIDLTGTDNYKLTEGDILFARTGASVGKSYIYRNSDGLVYYAGFLIRARINEECDAEFVFQNTLTDRYNKYIAVTSQRSGQPGVNAHEYAEFEIKVPQKEEQTKIGTYFRNLDHLITLHQRKCDETKKLKKYMLQKMFPQNGHLVPEIRFAGFTEDWEQRKLGDVLKERTERAQGGEELLSVTIANGVIRQADSEKRNIASEDKSNYKIVRKGDVPYNSMRMWQGAVGNSEYDGIVSPAYTVLIPSDEANAKFFMEYFKKENSLQLFQRWSQGLTSDTWNLKYPTLSSMRFSMPSIEEQNRIAEYFDALDHLITLHQQKCEKLQKIKKFMLQNMFV